LMGSVMNDIAGMTGPIGAVPVLIFGHAFNLLMGLMSVYIHNGRLAYVEFFGRFYTGDGTLFAPFGTTTKYTLLKE
ncbi:MAG: V-type ATP synthase subunit I, partial [Clostridia bacterium]|nr:V-type ATP synthase subunit I [Clostridia bacterium]